MSEVLDFTIQLAQAGGQVLRERFLQPREIHAKGWRDYYTDADLAAQTTIVELIRSHDSHAAILSEEGLEPPPGSTSLWVIDPLDGTTNYARQLALFAVSIAYVEQGRPIAGVVYDPMHEHVFAAEREQGAWLNSDRIHAATTADSAAAIIGLDWGHEERPRSFALDWLNRTGRECRTIRSLGSAALGLCYVAAGRLDLYLHGALKPWDGAAGQVIAEEAGVSLHNFAGVPWNYLEPDCLACPPGLVAWALESLRRE